MLELVDVGCRHEVSVLVKGFSFGVSTQIVGPEQQDEVGWMGNFAELIYPVASLQPGVNSVLSKTASGGTIDNLGELFISKENQNRNIGEGLESACEQRRPELSVPFDIPVFL